MANNPNPGGTQKANNPNPGGTPNANNPKPGTSEANNPKPGGTPKASNINPDGTTKASNSKPGGTLEAKNQKPGRTPEAYNPKPGGTPQASNINPGGTPMTNNPKPGGTPMTNNPKPGGTLEANNQKPGRTPEAYNPKPGGTPQATNPKPGGTLDTSSPKPGGTPMANIPKSGRTLDTSSPKPGGTLEANNQKPGRTPEAYNPKPGLTPQASNINPSGTPKASNPKPGGTLDTSSPKPGGTPMTNNPKPDRTLEANSPKPGGSSMANNPKRGRTLEANSTRPGGTLMANDLKSGRTLEVNNQKLGETPKKVSFPKEGGFRDTQQPGMSFQKTTQDQQPHAARTSQEDEHVRFFLDLYPDLRKSWASLVARRSSSPTSGSPVRTSLQEEIYLQREMGLYGALNFLLIVSIGTGIYLSPAVVLERAGSTTEALLVWLLSGIFSLLIAVTYGELVFLVSQTGERFGYLLAAFSPLHKFFGPLPAFLSIWIDGLFLGPAQVSLLALLLAEHVYMPIASSLKIYYNFEVTEPVFVKQIIGMTVIGLITCINFRSITTCIKILHVFGVFKMMICLLVIGSGIYSLSIGNTENFNCLFKDMKGNSTGLIKAMYKGMWSYEGWNNLVTISEEMKNPLRTIPRAILIGMPVVIVLFLSMNIAFLSVLTPSEIKEAQSKYIFKYEEKLFGSYKMIMPLFFAVSALSCAMCIQLGSSRTCFAAAREGHMLEIHTYLNVQRFVPTPALITQALISLIYILYIPVIDLIEYSTFVTWTFYGFAFVALIILRARMAGYYSLYKTPLFIPIILTTLSVLVTMDPLFRPGGKSFYVSTTFTCIGVIVYYQVVYKQKRISCMDRFNKFIRAVLNVAPPTALPEGYSHSNTRTKTVAKTLRSGERYYYIKTRPLT